MNKKFLSLVLALVMVLGAFANVFAAAPEAPKAEKEEIKVPAQKTNDAKIQWLIDHKIVEGRKVNEDPKDNELALDKDVKRSEITKLLVYALGEEDLAKKLEGSVVIYPDVKSDYWANGVITVGSTVKSPANKLPFLIGYDDGNFYPEKDVTYAELAKMLTVIVKEDLTQAMHDKANKVNWPSQWLVWANELGILDGVKVGDSSKAAPRNDAFVMLYNALYKMEDLRKEPANETRGIISAAKATNFTLNQGELAKNFKVDENTVFVNGKDNNVITWGELVRKSDEYYIGSFVRVLANEDGVVTHIVQLGNPVDGGLARENAWKTVAEEVVAGLNTASIEGKTDVKKYDVLKFGDLELRLNQNTNYYVADVKNGRLTKVADLAEAKDLLDDTADIKNVYAGYNVLPNSKVPEATEVVFNKTAKNDNSEIVRVVTPVNAPVYELTYNEAGYTQTANKTMSFRDVTDVFPFNYDLEKYDVIYLGERANNQVYRELLINYSEDNIYKIVDLKEEQVSAHSPNNDDKMNYAPGRRLVSVKLSDGRGEKWFDVVADAKLFFGDELKIGAFVQIPEKEDTENNESLSVISVVPADGVRGKLPGAKDTRYNEGILKTDINKTIYDTIDDAAYYPIEIEIDGYDKNYVVSGSTLKTMKNDGILKDKEVKFLQTESKYQTFDAPLAWNFELTEAQKEKDAEAAEQEKYFDYTSGNTFIKGKLYTPSKPERGLAAGFGFVFKEWKVNELDSLRVILLNDGEEVAIATLKDTSKWTGDKLTGAVYTIAKETDSWLMDRTVSGELGDPIYDSYVLKVVKDGVNYTFTYPVD